MDRKPLTYAKGNLTTKGRADDSFLQKQPWSPTSNPFKKAECRQKGLYNLGQAGKEALWGILCPSVTSGRHLTTLARAKKPPEKGNGATPKGNGCFECGAPGHFKGDYPKLRIKNGGIEECTRMGFSVGNARKEGKIAPGSLM
ncbi:putative reverse transcriptase domain-containing protein [Tanacetum coccineum]